MKRYGLLIIVALLLLTGCAGRVKPDVVVKTVTVEVPVPTKATPPAALLACGKTKPGFRFYAVPGSNDVIILESDQPAFQAWINEKQRCLAAWSEWAK